jgi:hypothetical protein
MITNKLSIKNKDRFYSLIAYIICMIFCMGIMIFLHYFIKYLST